MEDPLPEMGLHSRARVTHFTLWLGHQQAQDKNLLLARGRGTKSLGRGLLWM